MGSCYSDEHKAAVHMHMDITTCKIEDPLASTLSRVFLFVCVCMGGGVGYVERVHVCESNSSDVIGS